MVSVTVWKSELASDNEPKRKAGKIRVTASCGGPACEVEFKGGKGTIPKRAASAAKSSKFKLKDKVVSLAADERETVRLKFKKKHKQTVKKIERLIKTGGKKAKKRSKVVVKATATSAGGVDDAKLKIKLKP